MIPPSARESHREYLPIPINVSTISMYPRVYLNVYRPWSDWRARYFASAEGLVKADEETPDEDVARRDLVRGLLRMNLLPRLRYLLEVRTLSSPLLATPLCAPAVAPPTCVVPCQRVSCHVNVCRVVLCCRWRVWRRRWWRASSTF
jgi:hypothetical protein